MAEFAFVDTSFLVARFNVSDRDRERAIRFTEEQREAGGGAFRLVLSDYVFDEMVTALTIRSKSHALGVAGGRAILESKSLRILRVETTVFETAWKLFVRSKDKWWSFTDCTSFVLMQNLGIRKALAFDANFQQAGFARFP